MTKRKADEISDVQKKEGEEYNFYGKDHKYKRGEVYILKIDGKASLGLVCTNKRIRSDGNIYIIVNKLIPVTLLCGITSKVNYEIYKSAINEKTADKNYFVHQIFIINCSDIIKQVFHIQPTKNDKDEVIWEDWTGGHIRTYLDEHTGDDEDDDDEYDYDNSNKKRKL